MRYYVFDAKGHEMGDYATESAALSCLPEFAEVEENIVTLFGVYWGKIVLFV